jgi:hypothetical protein
MIARATTLLAVFGISVLVLAGCGGGGGQSPAAELQNVEKRLAALEQEESYCEQNLHDNLLASELNEEYPNSPEYPEAKHNYELLIRDAEDCIEENQEREIDLNHRIGDLAVAIEKEERE